MNISLRNIGIVKSADVEINGITVIAGENNTGKSTVGKALYSVFNSFYNINSQIAQERIKSIENYLDFNSINGNHYVVGIDTEEIAKIIVSKNSDEDFDIRSFLFENYISKVIDYEEKNDEEIEQLYERVIELANIDDNTAFKKVLQQNLVSEFKSDINNKNTDEEGNITLKIKDEKMNVDVASDIVKKTIGHIELRTQAIYLDEPYVLDESYSYVSLNRYRNKFNHRYNVRYNLLKQSDKNLFDEIVDDNRLNSIYSMVNRVFDGEIVRNGRNISITIENNKMVDLVNVSAGLKTFVIIKTLLQNGSLEDNGTIILDEPEVHLHPEWQILFAELIVLIQKQFNMHILINTHSPYFLNAIEVFAAKHSINSKCNYYIASKERDGSIIKNVTDNVEEIYNQLAMPFQILENERWNIDD